MELVAFEGISALLALALQRLDVSQADVVRARVDLDRKAARRVQRGLMSSRLPPNAGVTAYSEYLPALDVGGDFYSLEYLGNGKVSVAIGDVSGNGVSAALVMSRVASDIGRALRAGSSPSTVLRDVNEHLSDLESERFVTASCIRLDTRSRRVTVANAGHLPLIVRRAEGHAFTCGNPSGLPLGMLPCEYEDEEIVLEPRDMLLLITDGLLEALDHPTGRNGMSILLRLVQGAPHDPRQVHARIREAVDRARAHRVLDDVTWVGLQLAA
jgi:serine phosphatase RsbU (regulator of sigma subunit)